MRKEWEYEGKQYVIHNDESGNYYLNGHPYHCMDILPQLSCKDESVSLIAQYRAKEIVDEIEEKERFQQLRRQRQLDYEKQKNPSKKKNEIGISDVVFLTEERKEHINLYLSKFESKNWEYEGKQYVMHYDGKTNAIYLNGYELRGCQDIWFNVNSLDETASWRAKHKAKEISIAILESAGIKVDRLEWPETPTTLFEYIGFAFLILAALALVGGVIYLIYTLWWIFIGDSIFNGPFEYTTGEAIGLTILFFIALICVLSDIVLRIIRGHF